MLDFKCNVVSGMCWRARISIIFYHWNFNSLSWRHISNANIFQTTSTHHNIFINVVIVCNIYHENIVSSSASHPIILAYLSCVGEAIPGSQSYKYRISLKDDIKNTDNCSESQPLPPSSFYYLIHLGGESADKSPFRLIFSGCGGLGWVVWDSMLWRSQQKSPVEPWQEWWQAMLETSEPRVWASKIIKKKQILWENFNWDKNR